MRHVATEHERCSERRLEDGVRWALWVLVDGPSTSPKSCPPTGKVRRRRGERQEYGEGEVVFMGTKLASLVSVYTLIAGSPSLHSSSPIW
mmetsp:Transcript_28768/g.73839  ORF Transcript_28768/g.73839 Transcript_28768/m.73839 type:complete len:90 (-) Transcript_28768:861-1130(-)